MDAGACELVAACNDAGVPTAWSPCRTATSLARRRGDAAGQFDAVVTGDEVANGKPHPEPYLTAARMVGVDPAACVAIEDSPTGAASAQAAGTCVVVVPNHVEVPTTPDMEKLSTLEGVHPGSLAQLFDGLSDSTLNTPKRGRTI